MPKQGTICKRHAMLHYFSAESHSATSQRMMTIPPSFSMLPKPLYHVNKTLWHLHFLNLQHLTQLILFLPVLVHNLQCMTGHTEMNGSCSLNTSKTYAPDFRPLFSKSLCTVWSGNPTYVSRSCSPVFSSHIISGIQCSRWEDWAS